LYVSASQAPVNGCAFAQIIGGKIRFMGISDSQMIEGEKTGIDWDQAVTQWHDSISLLADEFTAGVSQMEIIHASGVLYHTHLLPLNRWSEEPIINKDVAITGGTK
jgi:hypothetical protein